MDESMNRREKAIEGIMAIAALACKNETAVAMGGSEEVLVAAFNALTVLGVTPGELLTVTLKSSLTNKAVHHEDEAFRHMIGYDL